MKRSASHFAMRLAGVFLLLISAWLCLMNGMGIVFLKNHNALFNEGVGLENEITSELLRMDVDTLQSAIGMSSNLPQEFIVTDKVKRSLSEWFRKDTSNFIFSIYDGQGACVLENETVNDLNAWLTITKRIVSPFSSKSLVKDFSTEEEAKQYERSLQQNVDSETEILEIRWSRKEEGKITLSAQWYPARHYVIKASVRDPLSVKDRYYYNVRMTQFIARNQRLLIFLSVFFAALTILLLFLLIFKSSYYEKNSRRSWADGIPIELYAVLLSVYIFLPNSALQISALLNELYYADYIAWIFVSVATMLVRLILSLWLILSFTRRCKCHTVLRNSLILRLVKAIRKGVVFLGENLAIMWKLLLFWFIFTVVEGFGLFYFKQKVLVIIWITEKIVFSIFVLIATVNLNTLERGSSELRSGNLETKFDLRRMLPVLRRHGENLNGLREAMKAKVDKQMRSERLKAELVTNVSHDIKTPLTSIINYVDLLKKEGLDAPDAPSYLEVLDRQSVRLKKLVVDLVEASKASTGNISFVPEAIDVNLLLSQAAGEYEDRMADKNLSMVLNLTPEPVEILADPKLLWRVFDNLLNNAMQYTQSGTRIYIDSEAEEENVEIRIRNISSRQLNISPEELMERFVRGDSSRNTEGSGLGLSIAESLTALQGGDLSIQIDGDLLKVVLRFPRNRA